MRSRPGEARNDSRERALRIALALGFLVTGCAGFGDETSNPPAEIPTWAGGVQSLMARECAICHTNPPLNGAPTGFRFDAYSRNELGDGLDGAREKADRIKARAVDSSEMPFGGPPLTPSQKDTLRSWIEAGAPQFPPDEPTRDFPLAPR